ncbi:prepilin peptidase [Patescibacteria group bacterium]|jgi:prepilin signal peptidase PulO-like enzyme (type II secretory pathway)|nr:prepilin peptidase [Patescibacteria group bacterium]
MQPALPFVFLFGTIIGSLLNALVYRLRQGITLWGRSQCPSCKENIHPAHLVPVLSYFFLGGKCASCGKRIHFSYPLVEFLGGIVWLIAFWHQPEMVGFVLEAFFFTYLLFVAAFDARWKLLPIEPMAGMALIGLIIQFFDGDLVSSALGLVLGAGFLGLQYLVSRGKWMGLGDLWLGASIGAWLGWQGTAVALYLCYLGGGLVAVLVLGLGHWKKGQRVAFAPFLALGAIGSVLFGSVIYAWFAGAVGLA